jgi:peptidylprolyl isomerase
MKALLRGLVPVIAALALGGTARRQISKHALSRAGRPCRHRDAPDLAPDHVAQIKALARRGFYDGVPFHRVIDGFMAQTGDPTGTGTGGSGHKLKAEFSGENMSGAPRRWPAPPIRTAPTASSSSCSRRPRPSTASTRSGARSPRAWSIDQVKKGDQARNGVVANPDKIVKMQVAADAEKAK